MTNHERDVIDKAIQYHNGRSKANKDHLFKAVQTLQKAEREAADSAVLAARLS